jgi:hypothetical protein
LLRLPRVLHGAVGPEAADVRIATEFSARTNWPRHAFSTRLGKPHGSGNHNEEQMIMTSLSTRPLNRAAGRISAALAAVVLGLMLAPASAPAQAPAAKPDATMEVTQIKLTEQHIKGFLGAQKDLTAMAPKIEAAGDTIDAKLQAELDGLAKKHGFKDFNNFDDVRANIMMVLAGIDPDTGNYTDPVDLIKKDMEAVKADTSLSEADRKQQLDELTDAMKEMQPLKYKENIELVKKYQKAIDAALQ